MERAIPRRPDFRMAGQSRFCAKGIAEARTETRQTTASRQALMWIIRWPILPRDENRISSGSWMLWRGNQT